MAGATNGPVRSWDINKVCNWLQKEKLSTYIDVFKENKITGEKFLRFTEKDFQELGLPSEAIRQITHFTTAQSNQANQNEHRVASTNKNTGPITPNVRADASTLIQPSIQIWNEIEKNEISLLKLEVHQKQFNIEAKHPKFRLPLLYFSARHNNIKAVELLLKYNANINSADSPAGSTALHVASYNGYPEVVKILLSNKADPYIRNGSSYTSIEEGSMGNKKNKEEIIKNFKEFNSSESDYMNSQSSNLLVDSLAKLDLSKSTIVGSSNNPENGNVSQSFIGDSLSVEGLSMNSAVIGSTITPVKLWDIDEVCRCLKNSWILRVYSYL